MPEDQAVTWVGALSGGVPVAAVLLVICWLLWKELVKERARNDALVERLIDERTLLVPLLRDTGEALVRVSTLLDRQASSNQAGGK